jgi:hypothetical protein
MPIRNRTVFSCKKLYFLSLENKPLPKTVPPGYAAILDLLWCLRIPGCHFLGEISAAETLLKRIVSMPGPREFMGFGLGPRGFPLPLFYASFAIATVVSRDILYFFYLSICAATPLSISTRPGIPTHGVLVGVVVVLVWTSPLTTVRPPLGSQAHPE